MNELCTSKESKEINKIILMKIDKSDNKDKISNLI